jgi:MFS family permease
LAPSATTSLRRSLVASSIEGIFAEVVSACAGGAVLTGFALALGCSAAAIAVVTALPFLAHIMQFPAAFLATRFGRRRVALVAVTLSRQAVLPLAVVPWLPTSYARALFFAVTAVSAAAAIVANNAWTSWMGDLVPSRIRGRYFGSRTARCTIAGSIASLAAGLLLDRARSSGGALVCLAILTIVSSIAGWITTVLMARQHDPTPPEPNARPSLSTALGPFAAPRFRPLLAFQLAWSAALGLSNGLLTLHMIQNMHLGFALVAVHGIVSALVRAISGQAWGRLIDRTGATPVLVACSFGLSIAPLTWTLPPGLWLLALSIDPLIAGGLGSGHTLASFALPLSLSPSRERPQFLAAVATISGLAFAAAAVMGGAVATHLGTVTPVFVLAAAARLAAACLTLRLAPERARAPEAASQAA